MKFLEPYYRNTPGRILLRCVLACSLALVLGHYIGPPTFAPGFIGVVTILTIINLVTWWGQRTKKRSLSVAQPTSEPPPVA